MRDDVKAFLALCVETFDPAGPVLELGSLQVPGQEGYADLRALFPGRAYTGCDVVAGPGVDRVADAAALDLAAASVGTVVAADSIEHMPEPARVVHEMRRVLVPGGLCLLTAPFIFPVHHPPDYWRFTPEGLARLLAPFPAVAVFGCGDAQWPHTVCAVASAGGRADFAARAAALPDAWDARGRLDPLVPVRALVTAARHDTADVALAPLAGTRVVTQAIDGAIDRLCRVCVKVDADRDGEGRELLLAVADAASPERPCAAAGSPSTSTRSRPRPAPGA